jgi:protein phosphatase
LTRKRLLLATRTDKGLARESNEDAFDTSPDGGVVVVADGMGGYRGGAVASRLAVEAVRDHLRASLGPGPTVDDCLMALERAIEAANDAILGEADATPGLAGMGSTVVAGVFGPAELAFAWVGDSRLYLLREGSLVQLTSDHTLVQELVQAGLFDSVARAVQAGVGDNVLVRALGTEEALAVDTGSLELGDGDLLLFCTDGLNHMVEDRDIERVMTAADLPLDAKAQRLVELACAAGGLDNITVVLAQVAPGAAEG